MLLNANQEGNKVYIYGKFFLGIGRQFVQTTASQCSVNSYQLSVPTSNNQQPSAISHQPSANSACFSAVPSSPLCSPPSAISHEPQATSHCLIYATAQDAAGNTSQPSDLVRYILDTATQPPLLDTTPPQITFISPAPDALLNTSQPEFKIEITDNESGIDTNAFDCVQDGQGKPCPYIINNVSTGATYSLTFQSTIDNRQSTIFYASSPTPFPDGNYRLTISVKDNANNLQSSTLNFSIDATAPTISNLMPASGSYINSNKPIIVAVITDNFSGISSIKLCDRWADTQVCPYNWTAGQTQGLPLQKDFSYLPAEPFSEGMHTLILEVQDAASNTAIATTTITIDTIPAQISDISDFPDPFSPNSTSSIGIKDTATISFTITDANPEIWSVLIYQGSSVIRTISGLAVPDNCALTSLSTIYCLLSTVFDGKDNSGAFLPDGTYTYYIVTLDKADNYSESSSTITIDTTPPTITNISDAPDPFSPNNTSSIGLKDTATISADITDANPATWSVTITDLTGTPVRTFAGICSMPYALCPMQILFDGTSSGGVPLPDSVYAYTITATDKAGNSTEVGQVQDLPLQVTIDNTSPTVSILNPTNNQGIVGTSYDVSVYATDTFGIARLEFYMDGVYTADIATSSLNSTSSNWIATYTWSTANLPQGKHVLTTRAYDFADNLSQSASITVSLGSTIAPGIKITSPGQNGILKGTYPIGVEFNLEQGNVTYLQIFVDNVLDQTVSVSPPRDIGTATIMLSTTKYRTRTEPYILTVKACKASCEAGHIGTSEPVKVMIDNMHPDVKRPSLLWWQYPYLTDFVSYSIEFLDIGSGVDPSTLKVWFNGQPLATATYSTTTQSVELKFTNLIPRKYRIDLTVADYAGNRLTFGFDFTIAIPITVSPLMFNPSLSETAAISYTLPHDASVTMFAKGLQNYHRNHYYAGTSIREFNVIENQSQSAGTNTVFWNGVDKLQNAIVLDDAYTIKLTGKYTTPELNGITFESYAQSVSALQVEKLVPSSNPYDPRIDFKETIRYKVNPPSISTALIVDLRKVSTEYFIDKDIRVTLTEPQPVLPGEYEEVIDRREYQNGSLVPGRAIVSLSAYWAHTNTIGAMGNTPRVQDLKVFPKRINILNNEQSIISYTLPENYTVTIELRNESNTKIRELISAQYQASGAQTLLFEPIDTSGTLLTPGLYSIVLDAADNQNIHSKSYHTVVVYQPELYVDGMQVMASLMNGVSMQEVKDNEETVEISTEEDNTYLAFLPERTDVVEHILRIKIVDIDRPNNPYVVSITVYQPANWFVYEAERIDYVNGETAEIKYIVPATTSITVKIQGEKVGTGFYLKEDELQSAGEHTILWDGTHPITLEKVPRGVYNYWVVGKRVQDGMYISDILRAGELLLSPTIEITNVQFSHSLYEYTKVRTTIRWETEKNASCTVYYSLPSQPEETAESGEITYQHSVKIFPLEKGKTYNYRIYCEDMYGALSEYAGQMKVPTTVTVNPSSTPDIIKSSYNYCDESFYNDPYLCSDYIREFADGGTPIYDECRHPDPDARVSCASPWGEPPAPMRRFNWDSVSYEGILLRCPSVSVATIRLTLNRKVPSFWNPAIKEKLISELIGIPKGSCGGPDPVFGKLQVGYNAQTFVKNRNVAHNFWNGTIGQEGQKERERKIKDTDVTRGRTMNTENPHLDPLDDPVTGEAMTAQEVKKKFNWMSDTLIKGEGTFRGAIHQPGCSGAIGCCIEWESPGCPYTQLMGPYVKTFWNRVKSPAPDTNVYYKDLLEVKTDIRADWGIGKVRMDAGQDSGNFNFKIVDRQPNPTSFRIDLMMDSSGWHISPNYSGKTHISFRITDRNGNYHRHTATVWKVVMQIYGDKTKIYTTPCEKGKLTFGAYITGFKDYHQERKDFTWKLNPPTLGSIVIKPISTTGEEVEFTPGTAPGKGTICASKEVVLNPGETRTLKECKTIEVIQDTQPPVITNISPADGAKITWGSNIFITATVTDNLDKKIRPQFEITAPDGTIIQSEDGLPWSNGDIWKTWKTKSPVGIYKMKITAKDCSGNVGEKIVKFTLQKDATPPTITLSQPANESVWAVGERISISGQAKDDAVVTKIVITIKKEGETGEKQKTLPMQPSASVSFSAIFSDIWPNPTAGTYIISAQAFDASEPANKSNTAEVKIYVVKIEVLNVKFMNEDYTLPLSWNSKIIQNSEDINISLMAQTTPHIPFEKMPSTLKVKLYAKSPNKSAGGTNTNGRVVWLSKIRPFGDYTEYHDDQSITPSLYLGIKLSGENVSEYAAVDGGNEPPESTDMDSNKFDTAMKTYFSTFQSRGIAKTEIFGGGSEENEIPLAYKETLNSAGLEMLRGESIDDTTKFDKILTQNQSDWFYYSGHGQHSSGDLLSAGGMSPGEANLFWLYDIDDLIIAGCSVLDIKNYRSISFCDPDSDAFNLKSCGHYRAPPPLGGNGNTSPGELWENVAQKVLLGYAWTAPKDVQGTDLIVTKWVVERARLGVGVDAAIEAWRIANSPTYLGQVDPSLKFNGINAAAIDVSKEPHRFCYWDETKKDDPEVGIRWQCVEKSSTGWEWK